MLQQHTWYNVLTLEHNILLQDYHLWKELPYSGLSYKMWTKSKQDYITCMTEVLI
jgi:hypothetical protein